MSIRLGVYLYKINAETKTRAIEPAELQVDSLYIKKSRDLGDVTVLSQSEILDSINPCSIDLHISNDMFQKPRRKTIDMLSVSTGHNPEWLWKHVRPSNRKSVQGILIKPHHTIITRTLERIKIPSDCAGKIEIKSTYARLSISVTTGDFCNPGWEGYYPLTIRNDSTNSIVIHPGEKMLQLSLVPICGPVVNQYTLKSTYMKGEG